jgi:predicted nuclease with RNAse H fold
MITLGIDLSSQPHDTAACEIDWNDNGSAQVSAPFTSCDDVKIDQLIQQSQVIGIDAPLGWPQAFVEAVNQWDQAEWNTDLRDELRFRQTDRFVIQFFTSRNFHLSPLSVSTDRIALPAMRAMALLKRHGVTDKGGDGRFYEVYPAGSLAVWALPHKGYKGGKADARKLRVELLTRLRQNLPKITIPDAYAETDHALDALVASLTARLSALGLTQHPSQDQQGAVKAEGWIHLPKPGLSLGESFWSYLQQAPPSIQPHPDHSNRSKG